VKLDQQLPGLLLRSREGDWLGVTWGVGVLFGGGGSQAEVRGMGDTNTHGKSEKRGSEAFDYPVASRHNSVVPLLGPTCTT
jgi:hypothetical protein